MAVSFPQNPNEGDTFTSGNSKFLFTDGKWVSDTSPNSLVSKSGDNMTGDLTLGTDKIVLDAGTGSATFSGTVTADSFVSSGGGGLSPTGSVTMFAGATVPTGWLECNGQTAPSALAAVLGQANVPDLRGEFVRGFDNGRGVDTGRALLSAQGEEFTSHTHIQDSHNHLQNSHGHSFDGSRLATTAVGGGSPDYGAWYGPKVDNYGGISNKTATNIANTATNQNTGGTETRPRNVAIMYIIKT